MSGDLSSGSRYAKPYTRRVNSLPMPQGYQPPKFQLFDGQGNPKQHIAHFMETCNNAGTDGDLLVKQFVRSLKGIAFDWYTDLEPESIDSWNQMEEEFLNRFYSTRLIVSMSELTSTKQWEDEPVVDYIGRWRALSLHCKDRISETSAVEMCIDGMNWELLYILKGIKPRNFQELATRAHDMEITVRGHRTSSSKTSGERKEFKTTDKAPKNIPKEAMNIGSKSAPVKISPRAKQEKKKDVVRKDLRNDKPTLKELQAKKYPFPDSDLSGMLDSLLENNVIQLPEPKRPAEVNRVDHPKYCRYHRLVGHNIEKCITLKELIMRLVDNGTIDIGKDEVVETNMTITTTWPDADEDTANVVDEMAEPSAKCASCHTALTFSDEDLLLGAKPHNRPLYVTGYIRGQKVSRILIDGGSGVNLMPKATMDELGITVDELSDSRTVIHGFNLNGERAIGMIRVDLTMGDLSSGTLFHVIESKTSFKLLLGRPWKHENGVVASTLHQCLKYYRGGERKINGDINPFTQADSFFADAKFFEECGVSSELLPSSIASTGKGGRTRKGVDQTIMSNIQADEERQDRPKVKSQSDPSSSTNTEADAQS